MTKSAHEFIDLLEHRGILPHIDVDSLREQINESEQPIHPVFVARRLVQVGYLNAYFAKTLLGELSEATTGATPHGDEADLVLVDDESSETAQPAAAWADEPLDVSTKNFDDMSLPAIDTMDLLSEPDSEAPRMLPSVRTRRGLAGLFGGGRALRLGRRQHNYEAYLLSACAVLAVLVVALIVYVIVNA